MSDEDLPPILRMRKTHENIKSPKKKPEPKPKVNIRRFTVDVGFGIVEGTKFGDGTVVVRWPGKNASTVVWATMNDFIEISIRPTPSRSITWLDG